MSQVPGPRSIHKSVSAQIRSSTSTPPSQTYIALPSTNPESKPDLATYQHVPAPNIIIEPIPKWYANEFRFICLGNGIAMPDQPGSRARPIVINGLEDVEVEDREEALFVDDEDDEEVQEVPRRPRNAIHRPDAQHQPEVSDKVIVGKFTWVDRFDGHTIKHNLVKAWFRGPRKDAESLTCQLQSENNNFDRQNLPNMEERRHCIVKGQGRGPRREILLESVHFKPYYQCPRDVPRADRRAWLAQRIQQQIERPFNMRIKKRWQKLPAENESRGTTWTEKKQ
ncbi:hypothetical protein N431DRAFT_525206 [Stipitochalara longipes BDJ]|nr:hypothetical protein N431DRAFT_525206 [Stipitochalara longipes BDJ]